MSWLQNDGSLIEGVLDLAFEEGATTVVVDFKTDHELAAGETRYRAQLQQYVRAGRPPGRPASDRPPSSGFRFPSLPLRSRSSFPFSVPVPDSPFPVELPLS